MEKEPVVFTRYDIRGEYPEELDEPFALRLGMAAGTYAKKKIVVGYDTRTSSKPLAEAISSGIQSTGVDVIDIGISPSDKVALAGGYYGADFSIMVTASHHSWSRNGFKFFYTKGNGFSNEDMAEIKKIFMEKNFKTSSPENRSAMIDKEHEFHEAYMQKALKVFRKFFQKIDAKIVVDCCNGAAYNTTPILLEKLGATVFRKNSSKTPVPDVSPEPNEENRKGLVIEMAKNNADLLIGHDPDADRLYAFDKRGEWISGDELFCIIAKIIGAKKIVASLDTSKMLEDASNASVEYTRVGDIFVSKKAIEIGADFCGEPNGHYAVPEFSWYNSATFCALLLAAKAKDIDGLRQSLPKYFVKKEKIVLADTDTKEAKMKEIVHNIKNNRKYTVLSDIDGIKFSDKSATCLIRSSGTQPVIRLVMESKDEKHLEKAFMRIKNEIL